MGVQVKSNIVTITHTGEMRSRRTGFKGESCVFQYTGECGHSETFCMLEHEMDGMIDTLVRYKMKRNNKNGKSA